MGLYGAIIVEPSDPPTGLRSTVVVARGMQVRRDQRQDEASNEEASSKPQQSSFSHSSSVASEQPEV